MNEKEVIQLLQHQRHDVMNHLQVIQGYMSMGNMEKVKAKLASYMSDFNEERKLFNLKVPLFALWVIQFNNLYTNVRLTYRIHIENKDLQTIDQQLLDRCQQIITGVVQLEDHSELYEGHLQLDESQESSMIKINFSIDGRFQYVEKLKNSLVNKQQEYPVYIQETENGITCKFSIACN